MDANFLKQAKFEEKKTQNYTEVKIEFKSQIQATAWNFACTFQMTTYELTTKRLK